MKKLEENTALSSIEGMGEVTLPTATQAGSGDVPANSGDAEEEYKKKKKKMKKLLTFESFASKDSVTEGRVKQFTMDLSDMIKNIKRGYGWIDPEFVEDTWENSSDSIDFELVKSEIYRQLIKAGLLATSDDDNEEEAGEYIKSLKQLGIAESVVNEAKSAKVTKKEWPYVEFKVGSKLHKVEFDYEDVIDNHGNEGQDQYWLGKDDDGKEWSIDVYADYNGNVEEVHYDTIVAESLVIEAKFVKDFNRDVLNAKTKEEVLELYPNAEFFTGKSDHFFGELDGNLFFKAYYTKAQKEFEIKSVYSEKGSNYVHLYNESVVTEKFNFSKKEVEAAANLIASAISQADKVKAKVHDLEYDKGRGAGFEISIDGEKYDGGSYTVKDNGDVVNAAIGNKHPNAVYNTIGNKDIADVFINMEKYESLVNEAATKSAGLVQFAADEKAEGKNAEIHLATFDGSGMEAQSTNKTWDDGVPVTKNFTRGGYKRVAPKGEIYIIESDDWWYFTYKAVWYAVKRKDYGTPPFEY